MKIGERLNAIQFFEDKLAFTAGPAEVNHMLEKGEPVTIVDVRTPEDYRKGHIPSAINLPEEQWGTHAGLSKTGLNVVHCYNQQCHLATRAALRFSRDGFRVMELEGGFKAWQEFGFREEIGESLHKAA